MTSTPDGHIARSSIGALEVVSEVLDALPEQRHKLAEALCGGDAERLSRVFHLLGLEQAAKNFLEKPLLDLADAGASSGKKIGGYTLVRLVGAGGSGLVYEVIEDGTRKRFALKTLQPHATNATALRRLELEAETLAKLDHPGIARLHRYEGGKTEADVPVPYLVLELVEGRDILAHCLFAKLDMNGKLRLMQRVCEAVEHAHRCGIVHRDLKPANVLIDAEGGPKVLDFGIACCVKNDAINNASTRPGDVFGTIQYLSPEQMLGAQDQISARSDVYSLGILTYRLITGQFPYLMKGTVEQAAETPRTVEPIGVRNHNSRISARLESILLKAMDKLPENRHAHAGELANDFRTYLATQQGSLAALAGTERGWSFAIQACRKLLGFGSGREIPSQ